jgi:uncharacterized membrane protein
MLRWLAVAGVITCILDPQWVDSTRHQQKSRVAVLVDTSRSMSIKDVPKDRLETAKSWLQDRLSPVTPSDVEVSYFTFNNALAPLPSLSTASPTGGVTALGNALETLLGVPADEPLAGVVVCSDGIDTTAKAPEAIARTYRRKGIPIYTLTVGTTNEMHDIVVENVRVKRATQSDAPTRVAISLRAPGYAERTVPVEILQNKKVLVTQRVKLTGGQQKVEVDFTPKEKGFQVYEIAVSAQEGEWLASNNRRAFGLDVVDPNIRVLYMEGTPQEPGSPIPEWKYLRDALETDPNIHVKVLYRKYGANGQKLHTINVDPDDGEKIYPVEHPTLGFPKTLEDLLHYDVVVHSDIRKESFTPEQLKIMARLVQEFGGGFLMVGGNSAFGKGGYHRTILDRIIPVAMDQQNDSQSRPLRMRVPRSALNHPLIAIGSTPEETLSIWTTKLPRLYGLNLVDRAKPGAMVLAADPAFRTPYGPAVVLAVQDIGKGRSMAFTSDTTRTWGRDFETMWGEPTNPTMPVHEANCDSRYYRRFWINAVRWLATGRMGRTNDAVTVELAQSYSLPGEKVLATIKVQDKEKNQISNADVSLILATKGKTNEAIRARYESARQAYLAEVAPPAEGQYILSAWATQKGVKLGDDRQLLVCEDLDREMSDLRARPDVMATLAQISGGQAISLDDTGANRLAYTFGSRTPPTVEYHRTPLWDKWWFLAGILGLLTTEWVARRLSGLA